MEHTFLDTIRVKAVGEYYSFSNREIAHAIKENDPAAIRTAAKAMSQLLTKSERRLLIPVPSHGGKATYTLRLAQAIAQAGCGIVYDVLRCSERETLYTRKQRGERITPEMLGFYLLSPIPEDLEVAFVDNVAATLTTASACLSLVGRGDMLVWALDSTAH